MLSDCYQWRWRAHTSGLKLVHNQMFAHKEFTIYFLQTPDEMSSSPASSDKNAIVSFNIDLIDVSKFSYVIIPTSLHVINLDQCLLRSSQMWVVNKIQLIGLCKLGLQAFAKLINKFISQWIRIYIHQGHL